MKRIILHGVCTGTPEGEPMRSRFNEVTASVTLGQPLLSGMLGLCSRECPGCLAKKSMGGFSIISIATIVAANIMANSHTSVVVNYRPRTP